MKKILSYIVVGIVLFSCANEKNGSLIVKGNIAGLKKGTIYLQKYVDTLLVAVDSVKLNGKEDFILTDEIETPEIYFIALDKINDERILFFGEKGEITITSKLPKFTLAAKISGSKNQELLEEYNKMIQQFNGKQLDLLKENFEASKINDTAKMLEIDAENKSLLKRKYYFTTNFAVNHSENEVAPYIALTELYNANIKLLDTVNNSLSEKVKASKYGVELNTFIKNIKKTEN
jgi:hypothetical protein